MTILHVLEETARPLVTNGKLTLVPNCSLIEKSAYLVKLVDLRFQYSKLHPIW